MHRPKVDSPNLITSGAVNNALSTKANTSDLTAYAKIVDVAKILMEPGATTQSVSFSSTPSGDLYIGFAIKPNDGYRIVFTISSKIKLQRVTSTGISDLWVK